MWATLGNIFKWLFTILPSIWGAVTYIAKAITDALEARRVRKAKEEMNKAMAKATETHDQRDLEKLFRK